MIWLLFKRTTLAAELRTGWRREGGKQGGSLGDSFNNLIKDDDGFDESGSLEDGEKWSYAVYTLKKKSAEFAEGSKIGFEREESLKTKEQSCHLLRWGNLLGNRSGDCDWEHDQEFRTGYSQLSFVQNRHLLFPVQNTHTHTLTSPTYLLLYIPHLY